MSNTIIGKATRYTPVFFVRMHRPATTTKTTMNFELARASPFVIHISMNMMKNNKNTAENKESFAMQVAQRGIIGKSDTKKSESKR